MAILTEQRIYWLLIGAAFLYLFNLLSPILSPFLFSVLLAYLGDPVADRLEKRMSRTWAVVTVFVSILVILILTVMIFIPLISDQLGRLLGKVPSAVNFVHQQLAPLFESRADRIASEDIVANAVRNNLSNLPNLMKYLTHWIAGSSNFIITVLTNIFLVPVVTFYLLRDWDGLVEKAHSLIPRKIEPKIVQLASESNEMLAAFLRGQFAVMNALGLIYAIGLSVVGVDS